MTRSRPGNPVTVGEASFRAWSNGVTATPEGRAAYAEESAKIDLWLQLADARQAADLTQSQVAERLGVAPAQVARIEKLGYDAVSLKTLRSYVTALGDDYALRVTVERTTAADTALPLARL